MFPKNLTRDTLTLPYNDADALREAMRANPGEIACVMLEPVAGNMGVVTPRADFLHALRELTAADGALLLFDEVITGFRLAYGGAQELFRITPDLTALGKIIGGGLPLAAYGGRADIMDTVAPVGPVYQAGTLSGNPLAVAAGLAQLTMLDEQQGTLYTEMHHQMHASHTGPRKRRRGMAFPHRINRLGSMMTLFFTDAKVIDFASAKTSDTARYGAFFRALLERGVYFAPSQFEAAFVSAAHARSSWKRPRRLWPRRCMSWLDLPSLDEPEDIDDPAQPLAELERSMRDVARTNRLFGGTQTILCHVARLLQDVPAGTPRQHSGHRHRIGGHPQRPAGLGPSARPGH